MIFVVGMRGGVALAFNGVFLITIDYFPARYKGTIFGMISFIIGLMHQ